jgi:putative two-component system response regulator
MEIVCQEQASVSPASQSREFPSNNTSQGSFAQAALGLQNDSANVLQRQMEWVKTSPKIMVIDDEPINVKVVQKYLQKLGYTRLASCYDSMAAMEAIAAHNPDLLILDIMMPGVSGIEILQTLKSQEKYQHLPVIVLTATGDRETRVKALELGASDFLNKPVDPCDLAPRVRNALALKLHQDHLNNYIGELTCLVDQRTQELDQARREVFNCLARAAEFRDDDTGNHVMRVGKYAGIIARGLGWHPFNIMELEMAAQLHDIGKIGVPDSILHKPGKLDPQEFDIMKNHPGYGRRILDDIIVNPGDKEQAHSQVGSKILEPAQSPVLQMACRIALTHHERWDGTGYPLGLKGEDIPIEGRITALADVFDALSSKRPYKEAFPLAKCFQIMQEGRGTHFDPQLIDIFMASDEIVIDTYKNFNVH